MSSAPYLSQTQQLVAIPSVTSDAAQLQTVLDLAQSFISEPAHITHFNHQGFPSLIASNQSDATHFRLILNGHLDVVAAPEHLFTPKIDGDKLIARGSQDMKAAAAVMINVFNEVASQVSYPLALQLVTDEETGGFHGTKHQIEQGIRGDFVIAGEPTDFGINNQAKGILWVKIKTTGKSAHGAYPWNGDNAISKMNSIIAQINQAFPIPATESWLTTVNIATIETANRTFNKVPDDCILSLDTRFIPQDADSIVSRLTQIAGESNLEIIMQEPSHFTPSDHPDIQLLQQVAQQTTGQTSQTIQKHGGSDIRFYNAVGGQGITFGPHGAGLHTDEEWVSLQSLDHYYHTLKQLCLNLK